MPASFESVLTMGVRVLVPRPFTFSFLQSSYSNSQLSTLYSSHYPNSKFGLALGGLALAACFGLGVKIQNRRVAFFAPSFLYDLVAHAFFVPNWIICAACYVQPAVFLQPEASEWNEGDAQVAPETLAKASGGESLETLKTDILARKSRAYAERDLVRLFDSLPAVKTTDVLVGKAWHGKILRTNASVLDLAEWAVIRVIGLLGFGWGKRYRTQHVGDPLVFNWCRLIYFPVPLWGNVGVTDIVWRGKSTGTMNYDHQPWKDYFRVLTNARGELVLLGVWTSKDKAGGWFTLTHDELIPM